MKKSLLCEPISLSDWAEIEKRTPVRMTQSSAWLTFLQKSQNAVPYVLQLSESGSVIGWFVGAAVQKYGLRILGSPFPGWTTSYMGFVGVPTERRLPALIAVREYAYSLGIAHLECMDREIAIETAQQEGVRFRSFNNSEVALNRSDEALLASFDGDVRTNLRYAEKQGVRFEAATDLSFIDAYFNQLNDVFAKQQLRPTYAQARVHQLWEAIYPTGRLLAAQARASSGEIIATGLFPADLETMYLWGTASGSQFRNLRPNEGLFVFAMRYWRERGVNRFDFGGGGAYKQKYNGRQFSVPHIRFSKYPLLEQLRSWAQQIQKMRQRLD